MEHHQHKLSTYSSSLNFCYASTCPFILLHFMVSMQMLLILTKSVNRCFEKNPKFDMTPLLGGTDAVFSSLIHAFSWFVILLTC